MRVSPDGSTKQEMTDVVEVSEVTKAIMVEVTGSGQEMVNTIITGNNEEIKIEEDVQATLMGGVAITMQPAWQP